ncbi:hypothetical protein BGZ99_002285 [Dissophora globulifera]|uniref:Uncharacterized protein n=1 Tax=Dissophora globulifera TaxID=979702 RepID=A0A9P6UJC2_9FUNG|nr:hypothetical protein BGZ99_002285 [Dissophora globulifera]
MAQIAVDGTLTGDCTQNFGTDVKFVQTASVDSLEYDLSSTSPTISVFGGGVTLLAVPGVVSLPFTKVAIATPETPVVVTGFALAMDIAPTSLVISVDHIPAFTQFLTTLFMDAKATLTFHGHTNATMDVKLPGSKSVGSFLGGAAPALPTSKIVQIPGISVSSDIELKGFNNFGSKPATVTSGQIFTVSTIGNTEQVRVEVTLESSSSVAVHFGDVILQVAQAAGAPGSLGTATVSNFKLGPGKNTFELVITSTKVGDLGKIFSGATAGLKLAVNGFIGSSPVDLANTVVANVNFAVAF